MGQPAYEQVADDLRAKIASGAYPNDATLPSTGQLMEAYGVSSTVVKAAIRELRTAGLVRTQQGKGVFVTNADRALRPDPSQDIALLAEEIRELKARVSRLEQSLSHAS